MVTFIKQFAYALFVVLAALVLGNLAVHSILRIFG